MKETELKPCPFCGGKAYIGRTKKTLSLQYAVGCGNSRCIANRLSNPFVLHYLSRNEAAEAWNRRAEDEQREAD
jgi:hypothetical protein